MRLKDADALLAAYDAMHKGEPGRARKLIEEAPTVDAVPVVRCKDCRYRDKTDVERGLCLCTVHDTRVRPEWFCWAGYPWEDGEAHG